MATRIAGPVRLPDGTNPTHGRVIFEAREMQVSDSAVLRGPVIAEITAGAIDISLVGEVNGTRYSAAVEYWSYGEQRMLRQALPDVVVTGTGTGTLGDFATVIIPSDAGGEAGWKRGDTIEITGIWLNEHDRPHDLDGVTITSSVLGPDGTKRDLSVALDSNTKSGRFELSATAAETADWPLGEHRIDVKFSRSGGRVSRTVTGTIIIEQEITT